MRVVWSSIATGVALLAWLAALAAVALVVTIPFALPVLVAGCAIGGVAAAAAPPGAARAWSWLALGVNVATLATALLVTALLRW